MTEIKTEEPSHARKNKRGDTVGAAVLNLKGLFLFCALNVTWCNKASTV